MHRSPAAHVFTWTINGSGPGGCKRYLPKSTVMQNPQMAVSVLTAGCLLVLGCETEPVPSFRIAGTPVTAFDGALKFEIPSGYTHVTNNDGSLGIFGDRALVPKLNINVTRLDGDDLPADCSELTLRMSAKDYGLALHELQNLIYVQESEPVEEDGNTFLVTTWQLAIKDVLLIITVQHTSADTKPPLSDVVEFVIESLEYAP